MTCTVLEARATKSQPSDIVSPQMSGFIPYQTGVHTSERRVADALLSLSFAEIKQSVSTQQLVDTVNELHAAVGHSVAMAHLFVAETRAHEDALRVARQDIAGLVSIRAASSAVDHRSITESILERTRILRQLAPPTATTYSLVHGDPNRATELKSRTDPTVITGRPDDAHPVLKRKLKRFTRKSV